MATSYTTRGGFRKIADGDTNYGSDGRANWDALDSLLHPANVFHVSPQFTAANLDNANATDERHFETIQDAIDAWESGGYGDNSYGAILVYPGRYEERLSITKSVGLYAVGGGGPESGGAARTVSLRGDGVAGSLISFAPEAGGSHGLALRGFQLYNTAADDGSELAVGQILDVTDQGVGNYGAYINPIDLIDCDCRAGNGNNNGWQYGLNVRGWAWLRVRGGFFHFPSDYASEDYVRHPFYARGNDSAAKVARMSLFGARVIHYPLTGTTPPSSVTVFNGTRARGLVSRCDFSRSLDNLVAYSDGTDTALPVGLASATEAAAYGNLLGIATAEF